MKNKLSKMFEMQENYNKEVNPDWRNQNYNFNRAIWVECAELLNHYGWKWWKKQECDIAQVQLELVDIWHFQLCNWMMKDTIHNASGFIEREWKRYMEDTYTVDFLHCVEKLAHNCSHNIKNDHCNFLYFFVKMCTHVKMDFDKLYKIYIGKNILNKFRLANGYKEGTYRKIWVSTKIMSG